MERVRGIEPPSEAWEASALPLSYTRAPRIICDPRPPASGLRVLPAVRPSWRRVDRDGSHIRGHRHFEDLEIIRGADLLMKHATGDEDGIAGLQPAVRAVLEFQLDPTLESVDELPLAHVVVPSGRLGHSGESRRYLRPHPPVGRLGDAEVAVFEEITPALDELWGLRAGHREFHCRLRLRRLFFQCRLLDRHGGTSSRSRWRHHSSISRQAARATFTLPKNWC